MILAHIFLPAMLLVICKTQQAPAHIPNAIDNEENVFNDSPAKEAPNATSKTELLDLYRQLIANSLLKLYDSCKVHDFLQNLKHDMESDINDDEILKSGMRKDHEEHYINTLLRLLEKQEAFDNEVIMPFLNKGNNAPLKSALYYYVTISMLLQDKELDETIGYMLYDKCCKNDGNFFTSSSCLQSADSSIAEKRNTIKKVKFHAWGGKRSVWPMDKRSGGNAQSSNRMPPNVYLDKDLSQSKIVIRSQPFRPWGGKR